MDLSLETLNQILQCPGSVQFQLKMGMYKIFYSTDI